MIFSNLLNLLNPYFYGIKIRNFLYDYQILKSYSLPCPVISVGNLSVGGTGKTSLVHYLAEKLSSFYKVGILLRGYKRKSSGFKKVLERGNLVSPLPLVGDEAYMLGFLLQGKERISIAVGEDRVLAGKKMLKKWNIELLILDDGFQHRRLARDIDLLLLKPSDLKDRLLPFGRLREPLSSLKRAEALILTYQELFSFEISFKEKPVFKLYRKNFRIFSRDLTVVEPKENDSFIAFSGLGDNAQFKETLKRLGVLLEDFLSLPDHFDYKDFKIDPSKKYLTTLKDFVKLPFLPNLYFVTFEIEVPGLIEFLMERITSLKKFKEK